MTVFEQGFAIGLVVGLVICAGIALLLEITAQEETIRDLKREVNILKNNSKSILHKEKSDHNKYKIPYREKISSIHKKKIIK